MPHKTTVLNKFLLFLFFALIFVYCANQIRDPDSFYHLKVGQIIWETKQVPHADVFSYTAPGAPWITHEWLAEIIFYAVQRLTGFWGLIFFVALVGLLTYFVVYKLVIARGTKNYVAAAFLFFAGYFTFGFWIPRPQIFSYLAFALLIYCLENYRREPKPKYLYFSAVILWFWASVNASFILGLAVLGFYALAETAKYFRPRYFGRTRLTKKDIWRIGIAFFVSLGISFINPNTYKIFLYSFEIRGVTQYLGVLEWRSVLVLLGGAKVMIFFCLFMLADAFLVWYLGFRKASPVVRDTLYYGAGRDITLLGIVLGVSLLPFLSVRHFAYWPIAAASPLICGLSDAFGKFLKDGAIRIISVLLIVTGILLFAARIMVWTSPFFGGAVSSITLPVSAADFIEANGIKGPLFNLYNEGGYLIWRFWPKEKVAIDGRSEIYGKKALEEHDLIASAGDGWEKPVNDEYKINYFILPYWSEGLITNSSALARGLLSDNFRIVYWDDSAAVFLKNSAQNKEIINKYGIAFVNPFEGPVSVPKESVNQVREELSVLAARFPDSVSVRDYADRFSAAHPINF
jgi:hypothetical protein